jgi:hypothetical protein
LEHFLFYVITTKNVWASTIREACGWVENLPPLITEIQKRDERKDEAAYILVMGESNATQLMSKRAFLLWDGESRDFVFDITIQLKSQKNGNKPITLSQELSMFTSQQELKKFDSEAPSDD